ncbi:somatostatin [Crotalus adamanteus]|uniref:Somatostatin n=1 Tax=Crotalus adamanteus TaxID=8729 RepID=A0AAW1BH02_CROAD
MQCIPLVDHQKIRPQGSKDVAWTRSPLQQLEASRPCQGMPLLKALCKHIAQHTSLSILSAKELAKYFLAELLSEPNLPENEALASDDLSRGAEQDEVRLELERSANLNPGLTPRERKAGCKNFFWKTFTSC